MPSCEIKIKFKDSNELITLTDAEVIKKLPVIERAISCSDFDWEEKDFKMDQPTGLDFPKHAGEFLLAHLDKYKRVSHEEASSVNPAERFPEAYALSLDQLRPCLELANYLEAIDFMHCMGFVIAKKLEKCTVEECAAFFGVPHDPNANYFDESSGYVQVPAANQPSSSNA
ncbi:Protein CBG15330 [Caenorhabditis briggsae]|uniref:Protein CBG15330 n=2 Tax=Caenorhabditis briggsae TaxID=6238 RepID=A8XLY5_CAEBR|nr:Protein CBG15330 [Caenorhabditis briggsae]ULU03401.1 hypothetical protein L3Y34_002751 [Caenorhabditis briggsae]CAP33660.1 Protein CBG15330 [Caenorhabditis briggsae]